MRVVTTSDATWFAAKDVAASLGYAKPQNAIDRRVSNSHKITYAALRGQSEDSYHPQMIFIDATGVYSLILGSNLPSSRALKDLDMTDVEQVRLALTKLELELRGQKRKVEEEG